jgi:hypothetical protein
MPTTPEQFFTLVGCISSVYISARLAIKVLYRGTVFLISYLERSED